MYENIIMHCPLKKYAPFLRLHIPYTYYNYCFFIPFCSKHEHDSSAMTPNRKDFGNTAVEETEQKNTSHL